MAEVTFSLLDWEKFLLVLVRIAGFVSVAPFYGTRNVPGRVKIGFSAVVSLLVCGFVEPLQTGYLGLIGFGVIIVKEMITGLLIGFAAYACNSIILFAGNIIDMDIGLSMVTEFDPTMNTQVTISGTLYNYFILLLLVVTNMHHYLLRALIDSYQVIPINGQNFQWDNLLLTMITFMGDLFTIAFRIMLPVFACIMILNCVLGVMAKVAPQMNMFAVGMQMKVLVGLTVLFLTVILLPSIGNMVFYEMKKMVVSVIEGMS